MRVTGRKNLIWISFIVMLLVIFGTGSVPVSASTAVLSASTIIDTALIPGETFYINVTVANIEHLWGYQFTIYYNTSVLTATSNITYDPFTFVWPGGINETAGWVSMSCSMPMGEEEGVSTVESVPLARIDFTVEALGNSTLELSGLPPQMWTKLSDPNGDPIAHDSSNGFFSNIVTEAHDIAITDITASPTTVLAGDTVTLTVAVENQGDFGETFSVSVYYDSTLIGTQTDVTLSAGDSTTLTFNWDTTGVAKDTYTVKAEAPPVSGEIDTADNTDSVGVTVTEEEPEGPNFVLYAVIGIVIVVVIAIGVYFLRGRKSKPA